MKKPIAVSGSLPDPLDLEGQTALKARSARLARCKGTWLRSGRCKLRKVRGGLVSDARKPVKGTNLGPPGGRELVDDGVAPSLVGE